MNVNRDLRYDERLAKSVRPFVHLAIYRQIEDCINKIGKICKRINAHHRSKMSCENE